MAGLYYRPLARLDLKQVYRHIAEANPAAAANLVQLIDAKARLLGQSPHIGRAVPELAANLHRLPVGPYLIFYEGNAGGIEVVRVLHGARDIEAIFRDS